MGHKGDPNMVPTRIHEIIRQNGAPKEEKAPRFIRDQIQIEDIQGAKPKPLYKGIARDIL
jgi:hypothetical protein